MKVFEKSSNGHAVEIASGAKPTEGTQDEIATVIALALHMYANEVRAYEDTVITIQQVIKPYSPWSSKIYGLRQQPMYIPGLKSRLK